MQRPVEKMNKTVEKVTDKVQKTVEECITATGESLDAMVERALKPRNFEVKAKVTQTAAEPNAPRGPPKYAMAGPDPAEFIANYGKQAKESAVPMSDIFQAAEKPAELLKQKLENLTAQITDQREALLKLENAYAKLGDEGGKEGDKLAQKITATEGRLISLQQTLLQTQAKYDKAMSGAAQATEKPKEAVASLGEQIKSTLKSAASKGGKSVHAGIGGGFERAKATASKAVDSIKQKTDKLGRSIKSAFKSAIFMAGLYAAFRALRDLVTGALAQNEHFSASLNALKANLQIAFTPILQSVMPMLNALMAGLAKAAKSLAVFMSALTGRTYEQSVAATKKLQSAAQGAKKTAKETAGALAGFDQVNNIEKSEAAQSTEGQNALPVYGDIGENIKVSPNVEKAANKLRTLFEPLQKINLNNLKSALGELKEAAKPITSKLFEGLEWAYYNLFVPLANWVISDALPAFLRVLAGALKVLNSILGSAKTAWNLVVGKLFKASCRVDRRSHCQCTWWDCGRSDKDIRLDQQPSRGSARHDRDCCSFFCSMESCRAFVIYTAVWRCGGSFKKYYHRYSWRHTCQTEGQSGDGGLECNVCERFCSEHCQKYCRTGKTSRPVDD